MDTGVGRVRGRERGAVVMEYISMPMYPGALTDTAARVLQCVSKAGVWLVSPADLNSDQLRALLTLRNLGYIEYAAYGGYRVKANQYTVGHGTQPPAAPVTVGDDVSGIARILVLDTASMKRVLVELKTGAAYKFDFTDYGWQLGCAEGLKALAASFGPPESKRLQSMVKVYTNRAA